MMYNIVSVIMKSGSWFCLVDVMAASFVPGNFTSGTDYLKRAQQRFLNEVNGAVNRLTSQVFSLLVPSLSDLCFSSLIL